MTGPDLQAKAGQEIGVSGWIEIDQARINAFADATEDWQFIHVNPEAAAQTPFGGTIAHGFLTLSLLSKMSYEAAPVLKGVVMGVNYGFEKIRFLQPVRAGKRVRGRFKLLDASERDPGRWLIKYEVTVEIEGEAKPALIAEWLGMQVVGV
ncbi:MAG: MaoC family dehydratase [Proteobacteria bacterium]|nr:MaoC family dehydratase [Pseudomonadota bacterium]